MLDRTICFFRWLSLLAWLPRTKRVIEFSRSNQHYRSWRTIRWLSIESLEGRSLLAVGDLRIVTYNVTGGDGVPSADVGTVLQAIGNEVVAGQSRPIDVLAIQEVLTQATTSASVVSQLNAIYGSSIYASGTVNGSGIGGGGFPATTVGLIYNTNTVQLVNEVPIGTASGTGQPRQAIRYQLRPLGISPITDFYLYNSHYKASDSAEDRTRRNLEAQAIRANSDSLPQGTHIIYAGDHNAYSSSEPAIQTLLTTGNGQAFDPVNRLGNWSNNSTFLNVFTQAPAIDPPGSLVGGGLDDRFDFQFQTGEWTDGALFEYVANSYHTFGNNGSVSINNSINNASSTALSGLANRTTILNLLTTVTDHLPVVSDYRFISAAVEQFVSYVGGSYSQTFDGLPSGGTVTLDSNGPLFLDSAPIAAQNTPGWEIANVGGSGTAARFSVGTGSSTTGSIYSFGASNAAERALGTLATSSMIGYFGVNLINNTGLTLASFTLNYIGEQWRNGGTNTADTLVFSYGIGVQNIVAVGSGVFTNFQSLDFVSPLVSSTAGSTNGNATTSQTAKSATVQGIQWLPGQRLVLRWRDTDDSGNDDGLAIDTLSFTASAAAPSVVGRYLYYPGTVFDTTANSQAAIDTAKTPLIAGQATIANVSSFMNGLTGVIVDIANLSTQSLTAADFEFRIGNKRLLASWPLLPPTSLADQNPIVVLPSQGVGGSTRVKIRFDNNAIRNNWLQIAVKANANTGLLTPDVSYFGSAPGEVASERNVYQVNSVDAMAIRQSISSATVLASKVEDLNKDGRVNMVDYVLIQQVTNTGEVLRPLNVGIGGVAPLSAVGSSVPIIVTTRNASQARTISVSNLRVSIIDQYFANI